ncbi:carbohydrate sulfotransferase 1-like [Babylonia areolata]|uniref:carbohydrate sulfotransferase 1-like n=1 Tax=Babylonia areolata TaxID=304850 RepID=UPI003FD34C4A
MTPEVSTKSDIQAKVIIVTYMRSGSSFTGDLFSHNRKTFYVFEPLWSLMELSKKAKSVVLLNRTRIHLVPNRWFSSTLPGAYLKSFLACDFYSVDFLTLRQKFMARSPSTIRFYDCVKRNDGLRDCLPLLFQTCRHADVTVVKTIRFSMAQTTTLMAEDPRIKVG